jgi:hypothetical protein
MSDKDEIDWIERNEPWRLKNVDSGAPVQESEWFWKLTEIIGIGDETVKDIGKIYDSEEDLKSALLNEEVPLRNDVVEKLKNYYKEV